MRTSRPVVLLTGFGPFPGTPENTSQQLVAALVAEAPRVLPAYRFASAVLPTEWRRGLDDAVELYTALSPVCAIHFGVSPRTPGFEVEMIGQNRMQQSHDACGALPASECIAADGPDTIRTGLPAALILHRLRRRAIPCTLSHDAGTYLCNALLYRANDWTRRMRPEQKVGFIHMPSALRAGDRRVRTRVTAELDWDQALLGGLEIIAATLGRPPITWGQAHLPVNGALRRMSRHPNREPIRRG
jgi:pyroglutamyl-peptidase